MKASELQYYGVRQGLGEVHQVHQAENHIIFAVLKEIVRAP